MVLDIAAVVLALLWGVVGYYVGVIKQGSRVIPILVGGFLGWVTAGPLAGFVLRMTTHTEPETAVGGSFLGVFLVGFVITWVAVGRLTSDISDADDRGQLDRFLGFAVGGAAGLVMAFVVTVGLLSVTEGSGKPRLDYGASRMGRLALERDFLAAATDKVVAAEEERTGEKLRGFERSDWDAE